MSRKLLIITLFFVSLTLMSCTENSLSFDEIMNDEKTIDLEEPTTEPTTSTTFGNPTLDINVEGSVYLTLNQTQDNLRQVVNNQLETVIDYLDPDLGENEIIDETEASQSIASVNSFSVGPNGEVVAIFDQLLLIDEEECAILYLQDDRYICIETVQYDYHGGVQFDSDGNVYYYGKNLNPEVGVLVKWDATSEQKTNLINQNLKLKQWLVHADGRVYLSVEVEGIKYFRTVLNDGSLVNLLGGNTVVKSFNFIDEDLMLIQGENIEFNDSINNGNFVVDLNTHEIIERLEFSKGDLTELQIDIADNVYVQEGNVIYKIYPGAVSAINVNITKVNLFKIFDNELYLAGLYGTKQVLAKVSLEDEELDAEIIINNQEIYHLVRDHSSLYFDALNFDENQYFIGVYDMEDDSLDKVDDISKGLTSLKSIYSSTNQSFVQRSFTGAQ